MRMRIACPLAIAAVLAIEGCKQQQPEPDALQENAVAEMPAENTMLLNTADAAPPAVGPLNDMNLAAPPPEFSDTEQMRDDADATGLTARLPADGGDLSSNDTQPAQ